TLITKTDSVNQLVEQNAYNVWVLCSKPSWNTKKCLNESWGFFVPFRVVPRGSIRWRLREVQGNGGTEPIPAGSLLGTSLKTIDLSHFFYLVTCCYSDK